MFEDGTQMVLALKTRLHPDIVREMGFSVSLSENVATTLSMLNDAVHDQIHDENT